MAISNENSLVSKLHVEAIQTIVPTKPTDPRQSFKLLISPQNDHLNSILQRRFHIILCYDRACDEDSGWLVAGRLKESLGRALQDEPLLAGRLRRCEDQCGEELEIVSNDSGVRLVEAKVDVKLADFVELKGGKEGFEGELVFWEDVVEKNPQFSPLFYVQVPFEDAKVEICSRQVLLESSLGKINGLSCARTWDELGLESICFNEGNKPVYVSCWINSVVDDEGFVMIIPSSDDNTSGMKIIVTFT
ncbi:hypothetical protein DH2020_013561 [Rehmannia glutinosa]|uniref:Uncharacterized protein n=1 Tax=Rehmannia glutinosa TaxID=99300 RepID=A0ABR0X2M7_REHGL